jgi:hypothetical protein
MIHLTEIIDGSLAVPFDRTSDFIYEFDLPSTDYKYIVYFTQDGDSVEVNFKVFNNELPTEGSHDQINIGMKLAAKVFHTVWKVIEDFLTTSLDPIDFVIFGAKNTEPSRVKFYRTLARQLALAYNQDPKYIDEHEDDFRDEASRQTLFIVPVFVE